LEVKNAVVVVRVDVTLKSQFVEVIRELERELTRELANVQRNVLANVQRNVNHIQLKTHKLLFNYTLVGTEYSLECDEYRSQIEPIFQIQVQNHHEEQFQILVDQDTVCTPQDPYLCQS
jgi:hypothetical protein